ncbi:hypothetical protein M409DRAFT_29198 [Zasmidium cellare ATCC 36951]|uniref:C2H2-type domain-containing protein n=1 Tax=Zasmidium cellare ATCC 36951 TaxID=1080233 RepID=A0A6A6C252_ZASCE|nr:uncharacterized protein M409DRAFT_29198 [Zasmidium cellare ATCC 36951]KAF2160348.1 hypothetical protein M409DRAFT_29198 [Zasmidium cellare ATCC 36951]
MEANDEMDTTQEAAADPAPPAAEQNGSPAGASEGRYACEHCNKSFGRREHYKRHQNIHTGAKPFPCPLCPRAFPRKDTLQRHVLMHGKAGPEALPAKIRLRTSRACWPCAKSKMRCDGEEPCSRCQSRGVRCGRRPTSSGSDDVDALMQSSSGLFGRGEGSEEYGPSLSRLLQGAADTSDTPQWTPSNGDAILANAARQAPKRNNEMTAIGAENPKLVPELQPATYVRMRQFWESPGSGLPRLSSIPTVEAMNVFIQLYFEHFHAQFPVLHMSTFQPREDVWMLVLAVAAIGAEYSSHCTQELMEWFEQVARKAVSHIIAYEANRPNIPICQSVLLFSMLLLPSGSEDHALFLQHHASLLATLSRNLIARRIADDSHTDGPEVYLMRWTYFADIEQERRFINFSWFFECIQYLASGVPPVLAAQELTRTLPCDEQFWFCASETEWLDKYQTAAPKKQSLAAVIAQPLTSEIVEELGNSALTTTFLTLLVERKRVKEAVNIWYQSRLENTTEADTAAFAQAIDADMECVEEEFQKRSTHGRTRSYLYLASILKIAPLDLLRHAVGIAAPQGMSGKAKKELTSIFKAQPTASRTALVYAAELFSEMRTAKIITRYDVRILVPAALYISNWISLAPGKRQGRDDVDAVRIDEGIGSTAVQNWVSVGSGGKVQVDGIGILEGSQAAMRALDGAARLLQAKAQTSLLGRSMEVNLVNAANGREE